MMIVTRRIRRPGFALLLSMIALLAGATVARSAAGTPTTHPTASKRATSRSTTTSSTSASSNQTMTTVVTSTAAPVTSTVTTTSSVSVTSSSSTSNRPQAPVPVLKGWVGGGTFPSRTLVLSVTQALRLTAGKLHITENGQPITRFTLTRLATAPRDLGVVIVIDQGSTMAGASLAQAMSAARTLASQRSPDSPFGLLTYARTPSVILSLTASASDISAALATSPWIAPGSAVEPALAGAYQQLSSARLAAGIVIVISDNARPGRSMNPDWPTDNAATAGIKTFAIGVHDGSYGAASAANLHKLDVSVINSTPQALAQTLSDLWASLSAGYLVRYRSAASLGEQVNVNVRADGVPHAFKLIYKIPLPPQPAPRKTQSAPAGAPATTGPTTSPAPVLVPPRSASKPAPQAFWSRSTSVLAVAGACALLLALGALITFARTPERHGLQARVASFIAEPVEIESVTSAASDGDRRPRLLGRASWWPTFIAAAATGRFKHTPSELIKRAVWGSLAAAALLTFVLGSVFVGILGLAFGPAGLFFVVRRGARKQRTRFGDQLPSHLHDLSGAMRVGRSFVGAIAVVAESADEPMRGELERALADEQLGKPLDEALHEIGERMQADDVDQVALIALLHRRTGANVAEALDRVAEGSRERADLRRELRALTAQSKISSRVLTALPVALVVAMAVIAPNYSHPMLHTVGGIIVLILCAGLIISGWFVMKKITNVEA